MREEERVVFYECESIETCTVGIPAEPLDFLRRAVSAGHPKGIEVHVDGLLQGVVTENCHDCPYKLAKKRIEFLERW